MESVFDTPESTTTGSTGGLAGAAVASGKSARARRIAIAALVVLCISCGITVALVVLGFFTVPFGNHDRFGLDWVWGLAPMLAVAFVWAALTAYSLVLVLRLEVPVTSARPGLVWAALPLIVLAGIVVVQAHYWEALTGFVQSDGNAALAIWLAPTLLTIALIGQVVRLLVLANKDVARLRGLRLLLWTAVLETAVFLLVNGVFVFFLMWGLADATSNHD